VTSLTRTLLPVAALAAALAMCVTGCQSATSTVVGAGLTSAAPSAPGASAARGVPSQPSSATRVPGSAQAVPPSAAGSASSTAAPVVYLAEGGSVGGTVVHAPACQAGCQLSGDGTTSLWDMTWTTWNSAVAVGAGTEKLDDCTPNCAAGTLHPVPVRVTLSRPAMVCVSGAGRWFWSRVSFIWPAGLPAAFSGGNAPLNPFDYPGITARAAKSCP
jgi:hypothetical protein